MGSAAAPARRGRGVLLRGTLGRAPRLRSGAPRRRRRGLHGRLLHREDGLLGLRLLHEELLLLHGDHHLLPAWDAASSNFVVRILSVPFTSRASRFFKRD